MDEKVFKGPIPDRSSLHLRSPNQREHHRLVLAHGHIVYQAAPERFGEFRNCLGQPFKFSNEPLELPSTDSFCRIQSILSLREPCQQKKLCKEEITGLKDFFMQTG